MWRIYNRPSGRKYGNRKVTAPDGKTFDSEKELNRYCELLILQRAGEIRDLETQKEFELIPAQYETFPRYGKTGKRLKDGTRCIEKGVKYIADFAYIDNASGRLVVEDTKGYRDPARAGFAKYVIKRKLMLYVHGIRIKEI